MKKTSIIILFLLSLICELSSQTVNIGIFHQYQLKSILISPVFGDYQLIGDQKDTIRLNNNSIFYLSLISNQIQVKSVQKVLGHYGTISICGLQTVNAIRIKSDSPKLKAREYEGDFELRVQKAQIKLNNLVALESYIAGVVESEGGVKAEKEYYKTQAILCRTYALENFHKHKTDRFNLCDGVHCQAYLSRAKVNDKIVDATNQTKGLVIVDKDLKLITAAFYSNSGGKTAASEMVWQQPRSYLKSIVDTFSVGQKNFKWTQSISYQQWYQFLRKYRFKIPPGTSGHSFVSKDFVRRKYYQFGKDSIPYTKIRQAFKLRSAYFAIGYRNNQIIFNGRGYGHGVGLSQEGAMAMALQGYSYKDIIKFYYQNVLIVSLRALDFFRE